MFNYVDPVGRNFLGMTEVETEFRQLLSGQYDTHARRNNSGFTWIEAFQSLASGQLPQVVSVPWDAFPLTAQATDKQIDNNRLANQDEYVEWRAEVKAGKLTRVTFSTEFPEYYEAFAAVGEQALVTAVVDALPDSQPTTADLFGPGFNPASASPTARALTFRKQLPQNPWNNGQKGILCLTQRFNTLGALFNLLSACGIPKRKGPPRTPAGWSTVRAGPAGVPTRTSVRSPSRRSETKPGSPSATRPGCV